MSLIKQSPNTFSKTPAYTMLGDDGLFMAHISQKKAEWYLSKDLADKLDEHVIQLRFKPKGYGKRGKKFFETKTEYRCVCCGSEDNLTRHHCVPLALRTFMPRKYKRSNYDILYLCRECHNNYEIKANEFKEELFQKHDISPETNEYTAAAGWIRSLMTYGHIMTPQRRLRLMELISAVFGRDIEESELPECLLVADENVPENRYKALFNKMGSIETIILSFRQHFLNTMKPQYMPEHWDPDYIDEVG